MEQRERRSRAAHPAGSALRPGDAVEVHVTFDDAWHTGFEVAAIHHDRGSLTYRLRRRSDGAVLPASFPAEAVDACA